MKKEQLMEKIIKHTYGITGPLDEQKRQEADRIGNVAFIWLYYSLLVRNFIAIILAFYIPNTMALLYPVLLEIALLLLSGYILFRLRKSQISSIDTQLLTEKEKKQLKHPGLRAGLYFGVSMFLLMPLLNWIFGENSSFFSGLFTSRNIFTALLDGLLFGCFMHLVIRRRIKQAEQEEED